MIRKLLKVFGIAVLLLLLVGAVLFAVGLRLQLDGGGTPRLAVLPSSSERADAIARHRESQRAQNAAVTPPASTAVPLPASPEAAAPASREAVEPTVAKSPTVGAPYWTNFRGPVRDGHYRQQPVVTSWPASGPKPIWKQPVGAGYASFVIANRRAFTIEQRGGDEVVAAYDVPTGRELWTNTWRATFSESMGGEGPRATPTWADGRVYALGATGELRALDDASGKTIWRTNILSDAGAPNVQWGVSGSPLIVDNVVVVLPGGANGNSVVAYDRQTGKRAWGALDDVAAYSSPMLVTLAGVRQILVFTATRLAGLSPDGRRLLWEFPWKTNYDVNASQPLLIGDNRVFVSTGYGTGAAVIELSSAENGLAPREVWRNIRMKNQFASSVLHEGYIYGLDESILACVDAATGELKWKGGRYGYGQIVLASGHVFVLTEGGELALVRATPERHQEVFRVPAIEGKTWNHPAMSDGFLLVRNINEMAAFDLRAPGR